MKKLLFVLSVPIMLSVSAVPAWATSDLTFEQSVARATRENPDLRGAQANVTVAEHGVGGARAGFLPQVSATADYTDSSGARGAGESHSTGISATQNLFSGFQDRAKLSQAGARRESALATLMQVKAQLSNDLKDAYAGLLYAQRNVALTQDILRRVEENLRLVQLRFESGRENKGSLLQTRASASQARLDNAQAQEDLASAQARLGRLIGATGEKWQATDDVPLSIPDAMPDFAALAQATPEYRLALAKQQVAEEDVRLARAGFYPSVDLRASRTRSGGDDTVSSGARNSVGASVSIPIFSGGRDYHAERSALAAADAVKAGNDSTHSRLLVDLRQAHTAYRQAVDQVNVSEEFLDAAQVRANIARAQYQNGLTTFSDWDRIEGELTQRQKASLTARRDRVTAEAAWELAQGKGVIP